MPSTRGKVPRRGAPRVGGRPFAWLALIMLSGVLLTLGISTWQRHRPPVRTVISEAERDTVCIEILNGNGRSGEAELHLCRDFRGGPVADGR